MEQQAERIALQAKLEEEERQAAEIEHPNTGGGTNIFNKQSKSIAHKLPVDMAKKLWISHLLDMNKLMGKSTDTAINQLGKQGSGQDSVGVDLLKKLGSWKSEAGCQVIGWLKNIGL